MVQVKVQCPAKINLGLKVTNKRPDGFHDIESIMQTISLYDYLTVNISNSTKNEILLTGNSTEIPYNEKNIVYKAIKLYMDQSELQNIKVETYIDKNIPVSAGMAGGSTDAAGVLLAMNHIYNKFNNEDLHKLCATLGSDLNVCLQGGRLLAQGRGEIITPLPFEPFNLSIIKPKNIGISAKEAYTKFSHKKDNNIDTNNRNSFENDLEWAIINDYNELRYIKTKYPKAVMTGSGSAYYIIENTFDNERNYIVINNLFSIPNGAQIIS